MEDSDSYQERRRKLMGNIIIFSDLEVPNKPMEEEEKKDETQKKVDTPPVTVLAEPLCIT